MLACVPLSFFSNHSTAHTTSPFGLATHSPRSFSGVEVLTFVIKWPTYTLTGLSCISAVLFVSHHARLLSKMKSFIPLLVLGLASSGSCSIYCGVAHGYDLGTNAYFYSGDGTLSNFDACSATCQASASCQSFAFGNNSCLLYTAPL